MWNIVKIRNTSTSFMEGQNQENHKKLDQVNIWILNIWKTWKSLI